MMKRSHAAVLGALAGLSATVVMTEVMSRMHRRLPPSDRYALPPRELTQRCWPGGHCLGEEQLQIRSLTAHFGYGALAGAVMALVWPRSDPGRGGVFGVLVWAVSYLGWAPLTGLLQPATRNPPRRNVLMITVHVVWGAATALARRSLERACRGALADTAPFDQGPTDVALARRR